MSFKLLQLQDGVEYEEVAVVEDDGTVYGDSADADLLRWVFGEIEDVGGDPSNWVNDIEKRLRIHYPDVYYAVV